MHIRPSKTAIKQASDVMASDDDTQQIFLTSKWLPSALRPEYSIVAGIKRTEACTDNNICQQFAHQSVSVNQSINKSIKPISTLCLNDQTLKRYSSKLDGSIFMIFSRDIQKSLE